MLVLVFNPFTAFVGFLTALNTKGFKEYLLIDLGWTFLSAYHCKNIALLWIICWQIKFICEFLHKLLSKNKTLVEEIVEGLYRENDISQLRKYFSQLCGKRNDELTPMLLVIAYLRQRHFLNHPNTLSGDGNGTFIDALFKKCYCLRKKDLFLTTD